MTWLLKQPWAGWVVAVCLAFLWLHSPRTVTVTKTEFKERVVIKTEWKAQISAREGSTTTIAADGTTTISGPVEIRTDVVSTTSKSVDSKTTTATSPAPAARWSAGGIAMLPSLSPRPAYGGTVGYRLLGPVWLEGQVVMREALPDVGIAVRVTF